MAAPIPLTTPRTAPHRVPPGGALWALGFRPFYLLAGAYAALAVPLWALQFAGWLPAAAWAGPQAHAHEMLFGFTLAVIVGFLFTAGRNWSGQPTPTGRSLQALAALWLAGRVLAWSPWPWAALLANMAFPLAAAWGLGRALRAGPNRRNDFFIGLLVLLGLLAGGVHAARLGWVDLSGPGALVAGLDVVLLIITIMAGRVVPMFTNNGIPGARAASHRGVERAAVASVLALLLIDAARVHGFNPPAWLATTVAAVGAAVHAWRWSLWRPLATLRNPLVGVLHLAYAFVPLHLALRALAAAGLVAPGPATHALTAGAIGLLTLGMMTRSARGHTGRPLKADAHDVASYALVATGALLRVGLPLAWPAATVPAAVLAAMCWSAGFAVFTLHYAPWLTRPRLDGQPG